MLPPRNIARLAAEAHAAFAGGDDAVAEALSRRVLAHDLTNEDALATLSEVLVRTGRPVEAVALNRAVLAHFRGLQLRNTITFGLHLLHERGFVPRGVLDVGAYDGEFTLLARQFWPAASALMVEPQLEKRAQLDRVAAELGGDVHVRSVLLGERERAECAFHEMSTPWGSTGSSLYPEVSDFDRATVTLPMATVDTVLAELPGRCFDLVKIDVQGAELDVLRGAATSLPDVQVLFAELALHECNRGAPRLAEVVAALDGMGFAMFDLLPMGRDDRGLQLQVDTIFVRRDSKLWQQA